MAVNNAAQSNSVRTEKAPAGQAQTATATAKPAAPAPEVDRLQFSPRARIPRQLRGVDPLYPLDTLAGSGAGAVAGLIWSTALRLNPVTAVLLGGGAGLASSLLISRAIADTSVGRHTSTAIVGSLIGGGVLATAAAAMGLSSGLAVAVLGAAGAIAGGLGLARAADSLPVVALHPTASAVGGIAGVGTAFTALGFAGMSLGPIMAFTGLLAGVIGAGVAAVVADVIQHPSLSSY